MVARPRTGAHPARAAVHRSVSEDRRALDVAALTVRYDDAPDDTLAKVSFSVEPGEVALLLGPSGSGKSTLALALCGLIPQAIPAATDGGVLVDGADVGRGPVPELSTRISIVFQDPDAQVVTGTVLDDVCFGPENLRLGVDEVLMRAEEALRHVGLWDRRHDDPAHLSGGGRQRMAIACALAMRGSVIVLDEPTANIDPAGVAEIYAALADPATRGDRAILLIEHNLDECIHLVDRLVVLDRSGRIAMQGSVDELLRHRTEELARLGVWMPVATLAAQRLAEAGIELDPLPITPDELATALDRVDLPPPPVRAVHPPPAEPSPPVLRIRDLVVRKGTRDVLSGIDLTVDDGDFLAVLGVNGAGKTTLLRAIAALDRPASGRIMVAGLDPSVARPRDLARQVGFVFQNPEHQFLHHTVADELAHGADGRPERVDQLLEQLDLTAVRDQHPFLLSGGQKRRLSVATALVTGARVLVLDEPSYGQDREHADELLGLLTELHRSGTTVIISTHDLQLAAEHATRFAVLGGGCLVASGPVDQVLGDDGLERAGLRLPPLARAMRSLLRHPDWRGVLRLADLPAKAVR